MTWDLLITIGVWALFLFVWFPRSYIQYRKRMASARAINKGYRFTRKYRAIRELSGRAS